MSMLMARPLLAPPDEIRLWVGLFDVTNPPQISFHLDGAPWQPTGLQGLFPIRDGAQTNHQGIFSFPALGPGIEHRIRVEAGNLAEPYFLRVRSLPDKVPTAPQGSFKIMLMSCYCVGTDQVDVGRFIQRLPERPDMALFAGDQVYLDQPPLDDMPSTAAGLRSDISAKYRRNWLSELSGQSGLQQALSKAPAVCLPDDHEYWNNYPWEQFWKKGTQHAPTPTGLNFWDDAARELFQDYQLGGSPNGHQSWRRLDIEPLCMLFIDTRSHRQLDFDSPIGLMTMQAEQALMAWKQQLINHKNAGKPHIGILATGQTLFCESAQFGKLMDAELPNYQKQFAVLIGVLESLAELGIQVVFLTGDVHWSRVAQARHTRTGRTTLTEVICSPSSLCVMPALDQWASFKDEVRGIFGTGKTWFRHSAPKAPPATIGAQKQFTPRNSDDDKQNRWSGNQVAIVEFSRWGSGVQMKVTYHPITFPASLPITTRPFTLLNT